MINFRKLERVYALIAVPFTVIWGAGLFGGSVVFGYQLGFWIVSGYEEFPNGGIAYLLYDSGLNGTTSRLDELLFMILDLIGLQHWPKYVLVTHPLMLLSGLTGLFIAPMAYLSAIDDMALQRVLSQIGSITHRQTK